MRRRTPSPRLVALCASGVMALASTSALAAWSTVGSGSGSARTGTLSAPAAVTADAAGQVRWTAGAVGDGAVPATGFRVERSTVALPDEGGRGWSEVCATTTTACTDGALPTEPGTYRFAYRVVARFSSAWTATSAESEVVTVTVAPSRFVSAPDLDPASDTGSSAADDLTRLQVLTLVGTATAGAQVQVLDGSTVVGSATATGGHWSITTAALAGGAGTSHSLTARATVDGEVVVSAALVVVVDTVAPPSPTASVAGNGSNSDNKVLSGTAATETQHAGALPSVTASVTGVPAAKCSVQNETAAVNQSTGGWTGPSVNLNRSSSCAATVTQLDRAGNASSVQVTVTRG